ncbi:hypothetical protein Efla_001061 [Eimeria flavescens]
MGGKHWTDEELAACYEKIKSSREAQHANYGKYLENAGKERIAKWQQLADDLQLELQVDSGRIRYKSDFKPLDLEVDICYVRHGKTQGNTEPRVYQGMVDYPENQLNSIGKEQAVAAAEKMEQLVKQHWQQPDAIFSSPLQRAQQTAEPFRQNHRDLPYRVLRELMEMKFGSWDNQKVADLPADDICHLFYLEQNALVKSHEPHAVDYQTWVHSEWLEGAKTIEGENFLECMQRQREALRKVAAIAREELTKRSPEEKRKPRVVLYGHSMAGAAVSVLLGFGKEDASGWLGFDGHYIMPNATPTLLIPQQQQQQH